MKEEMTATYICSGCGTEINMSGGSVTATENCTTRRYHEDCWAKVVIVRESDRKDEPFAVNTISCRICNVAFTGKDTVFFRATDRAWCHAACLKANGELKPLLPKPPTREERHTAWLRSCVERAADVTMMLKTQFGEGALIAAATITAAYMICDTIED